MAKFTKGISKPANSGIKKGQKQTRTVVKKQVYELLSTTGKHPVTEIMKLIPNLAPKEQVRVWLELLPYVSPKLSAQTVDIVDNRETEGQDVIDVTPLTDEELINQAKEGTE